jgi:serine/threonine-protein kinase
VLPFLNSTGDPAQEYFSDAMTDEIIAELAALSPRELAVIARTTAMHYKETQKNVAAIARELALDWVVEGSVRRADGRVTLTLQLVRASDQAHVFAKRYDADANGIFDLQRSVAEDLVERMGGGAQGDGETVGATTRRPAKKPPTTDLVAYNHYIEGRHHLHRGSPAHWAKARDCLEAAVARDPQFALAYDRLAELWWALGFFGFVPARQALTTGLFHALRALEIDNGLADTHALVGQYRKQLDFNWAEVRREMALALELDPGSPEVLMRRAQTELMPFGRLDEAVSALERALEVDPLAPFPRIWLAFMFGLRRDYDRGLEQVRLVLEVDPTNFTAHFARGLTSLDAGRPADAVDAFRRSAELSGGLPLALGGLGLALAKGGDAAGARALGERIRAMPPHVYVPPTSLAFLHLGLGEIDAFFEWMDRAIDARDHMITPIKTYPFFDPIRGDPRYDGLLRKMNLEAPAIVA